MAKTYFEASAVNHDFSKYSKANLLNELEDYRAKGVDAEKITELERYLNKYPEEFGVLYRVLNEGVENVDEGKSVRFEFKDIPYERPEIVSEEDDVKDQSEQLELVCTFEDGTKFGLSALKATPQTADEPLQMTGRIHFDEETLKSLNEEKLNRIFEFCDRYGFSRFGLDLPMKDGEIDIDAKLAELFARYQENQAKAEGRPTLREADDYVHLDTSCTSVLEVDALREEAKLPETTASASSFPDTTSSALPSEDSFSAVDTSAPAKKVGLGLRDVVENIENLLTKDLHKRKNRSYWKDVRFIEGRKTYVFTIYDKEDPKNREKDGKKKDDQYVETFSARLYVSQERNGKFHFGYATPNGKAFDSTLANQFMGEIKKTGITHINLQNVPACDQDTVMFAAAGRGIVPTGINITSYKAKQLLEKIGKLSAEEQAAFKRRLADQMMENARKKNPDKAPQYGLADSEFDFIQDLKEKSEDEAATIQYLPIKRKFRNFRDAIEDKGPNGLKIKIQQTASMYADSEIGAAWVCASGQTTKMIFDMYFKHFDETLGDRLAPLIGKGGVNGISKEEAVKLASISSKKMGDMTTEDFSLMYDVLLPKRAEISKKNILTGFERKVEQGDSRAWHIIIQNGELQAAQEALGSIDATLNMYAIDPLKITLKKSVRFDVPEHLRPKKEKKEPIKTSSSKTSPVRESR